MTHALEIERKFLVRLTGSLPTVQVRMIEQGYLPTPQDEGELRVRLSYDPYRSRDTGLGSMTIKHGQGLVRQESEVRVRSEMARAILDLPGVFTLTKRRIQVGYNGWIIDQYLGAHDGLVVAEIELPFAQSPLPEVPSGLVLGPEVTGNPDFSNKVLAVCAGPWAVLRANELLAAAGIPFNMDPRD